RCVWLLRAPGALRGNPYVHYLNFGRVAPALSHHHRMQTGSTAMLTHSAIERTSTAHQPARPNTTSAGSKAFQSSIELMGAPMPFGRNAEIYGENEPAEYIYKVISGTVRTYKVLNDGRRQIGAFYLPGDMFGLEIGDEHSFSAEAIVDSKVL